MTITIITTFLFFVHCYVHFSILRPCSFSDLMKITGALAGLVLVMAFVSVIPVFNPEVVVSDNFFGYLFIRSAIEEISKIVFCYVLFENLSSTKLKQCTLAFCLILSFYEMFPVVYPLYAAAAEYWINAIHADLPFSHLHVAEVKALTGVTGSALSIIYNILRIYLHYKLVIFGVEWLLKKSWWCSLPVGIHGVVNVSVLAVDTQIANSTTKLYLYTFIVVCLWILLHVADKYLHHYYAKKSAEKPPRTCSLTTSIENSA